MVDEPVREDERFIQRLCIPYLTLSGVVSQRFRCLADHNCHERGCSKYLGRAGADNRLYGVDALHGSESRIIVTEGELDRLTLTQCGFGSVAVPGASSWKQHYGRLFEDFARVYVFADGDDSGRRFGDRLAEAVGARVISMPEGEDVNSIFVKHGRDYFVSLLR